MFVEILRLANKRPMALVNMLYHIETDDTTPSISPTSGLDADLLYKMYVIV